MPSLRIKRGTLAQLQTAASASQLKEGEPYLITDTRQLAVGTGADAYAPVSPRVGTVIEAHPDFAEEGWLPMDGRFVDLAQYPLMAGVADVEDGAVWETRHAGSSQFLYGVAWSGTQFVVVGGGGTILTSADGIAWTARASYTTQTIRSVSIVTEDRVWVTGGGGLLISSPIAQPGKRCLPYRMPRDGYCRYFMRVN